MSGKALVCKLHNISPIEGADRIVRADLFNETVITGVNNVEGTIGLLFDCDTQLSEYYASANNMFRHSELNSDNTVKGYLEDDRRVRPVKMKGVKCTALFMPLETLEFIGGDVTSLREGEQLDSFCGVKLCNKYITPQTQSKINSNQKGVKKSLVPTFKEHFDTDQLQKNTNLIKEGSMLTVTEKVHGTSARCGYLPVDIKSEFSRIYLFFVGILEWIFGTTGIYEDYRFVVGSRRVVKSIGEESINGDSYYDHDIWTQTALDNFEGKLHEGETVYYEIVGYLPDGSPIMSSQSTAKLKSFLDKEEYEDFVRKYGEIATFNYGCEPGQHRIFVYRITMTNEDGVSVDYSWQQVKHRCDQLGVEYVPEINEGTFIVSDPESTLRYLNMLRDKSSETFPDVVKEGICVRIDGGSLSPTILKDKTYTFKVLDNIIKEAPVVDMEEAN